MKRRGVTVVEVLAGLGVLFLLAPVVGATIQQLRAESQLIQCRDNLHNVGVAIHNYAEANFDLLPLGWVAQHEFPGSGSSFGWGARLLPFVDEVRLYETLRKDFRRTASMKDGKHAALRKEIAVYRCPADKSTATNPLRSGWAVSNYAAVWGIAPLPVASSARISPDSALQMKVTNPPQHLRGVIGFADCVSWKDISGGDGAANTFVVGERCSAEGAAAWPGLADNGTPDDVFGDCAPGSEINRLLGTGFSSWHRGGAVFLFCDGRVKLISEKIESHLRFKASGTIEMGLYQRLAGFADGGPKDAFRALER